MRAVIRRAIAAGAAVMALSSLRAAAQVAPPPIAIGPLLVGGSFRVRLEAWDWFTPSAPADNDYTFGAGLLRGSAGMVRPAYDWQLEVAVPMLVGLPDDAVAPAPQGQLGLGATYWVENGDRKVGLLLKQGFFRWKLGHGPTAPSLRLGRFEFNDGQETQPRDPTLAWLKRERISQRLIGNFGFSHVGRSLDGAQFKGGTRRTDITLVAARPTAGVFQLNGLGELDVEVAYAALTRSLFSAATPAGSGASAETRLFAVYYRDGRGTVKADNRASSVRTGDRSDIDIATFGGHYLQTMRLGPGKLDLVLWGAVQLGDWGAQRHRAHAYTGELGYRLDLPTSPWLRVGYFRGSGDDEPADGSHRTFFELIPTPRPYARLPLYNLMNLQDGFLQLLLSPTPRLALRADGHLLRLAAANDLWYSGGGAFDPTGFGYTGRPSGGTGGLGRLVDLSADWQASPRFGVAVYVGHMIGGEVIRSVYPQGGTATFGYLELTRRL